MLDNRNGSGASIAILKGDLGGRFFSSTTDDSVVQLSGKKDRKASVCLESRLSEFSTCGRLRCRSARYVDAFFALWSTARYVDHLNRSLEATARAS